MKCATCGNDVDLCFKVSSVNVSGEIDTTYILDGFHCADCTRKFIISREVWAAAARVAGDVEVPQ